MPFVGDYANDFLDGGWANLPTGKVRAYASDPTDPSVTNPSDVELASDGGYTPDDFDPSTWDAATGSSKSAGGAYSFGTPTDAFSDPVFVWGVTASTDADDLVYWDYMDDPIDVEESGDDATFTPTILYGDGS